MKTLKNKLKIVVAVSLLLFIGVIISYTKVIHLAKKENPDNLISYVYSELSASPGFSSLKETYFKIENQASERKYFDLFWTYLDNEYAKESLTYTLEYRDLNNDSWVRVGTSDEYIPSSSTVAMPLAEAIAIEGNSTYVFKLRIINENCKVDEGELNLKYRIDFQESKKKNF